VIAGKRLGLSSSSVTSVVNGKIKSAGGGPGAKSATGHLFRYNYACHMNDCKKGRPVLLIDESGSTIQEYGQSLRRQEQKRIRENTSTRCVMAFATVVLA